MKPIIFNTEMTRAILEGRKTVTRRVIKPQPPSETHPNLFVTPPYQPNDILYVKETYNEICGEYIYKAEIGRESKWPGKWLPSVHMPKEAARIFLRVTDVRLERLQDIDHAEIRKAGIVTRESPGNPNRINQVYRLKNLWNSTIKPADRAMYGWEANPWVFVIEFDRISKEEAEL